MKSLSPQQLQHIVNNKNFTELDLDSLDQVELMVDFEQKFGVELDDHDSEQITGVHDLINYIVQHPKIKL